MSVVNKVLRDLDARQAGASDRVGVPSAVTPLSVHLGKKRPVPIMIPVAMALALAGEGIGDSILKGLQGSFEAR